MPISTDLYPPPPLPPMPPISPIGGRNPMDIPRGEPGPATISVEEIREAITGGILDAVRALAGGISLRPDEIAALAEYNARQTQLRQAAHQHVAKIMYEGERQTYNVTRG